VAALCLTLLMGLRLSMGYEIAAFVFFLFSPMAFTLSATTHTHLLSRALLALALGLGTFILWQGIALNRQAQNQKVIYGRIEQVAGQGAAQKSVVLAPRFRKVWENVPEFKNIGGWVFQWRRARPDLSDRILIVHDVPGAEEALRKRFPERKFFRLRNVDGLPYFEIEALDTTLR